MYFKTKKIWSKCGQHMLAKSGLNTHLEKVKIVILQYRLMKIWGWVLISRSAYDKNEKFVYNRWVLHHKRMYYHLKRPRFIPTSFIYNLTWKFVGFGFYGSETPWNVDEFKIWPLVLV